jgi:hypothetical protein
LDQDLGIAGVPVLTQQDGPHGPHPIREFARRLAFRPVPDSAAIERAAERKVMARRVEIYNAVMAGRQPEKSAPASEPAPTSTPASSVQPTAEMLKWNVSMPGKRWSAFPSGLDEECFYRVEKTRGSYKAFRQGPKSNSRDNAKLGAYGFLKEAKAAAEADWVKRSAIVPPHDTTAPSVPPPMWDDAGEKSAGAESAPVTLDLKAEPASVESTIASSSTDVVWSVKKFGKRGKHRMGHVVTKGDAQWIIEPVPPDSTKKLKGYKVTLKDPQVSDSYLAFMERGEKGDDDALERADDLVDNLPPIVTTEDLEAMRRAEDAEAARKAEEEKKRLELPDFLRRSTAPA